MMFHLFFIFVLLSLAVGKERVDGPLTENKGRELMMSKDCNMLSMLPATRADEEEYGPEEAYAEYLRMGLRPREAAPEDGRQQEEEEEEEGTEGSKWFNLVNCLQSSQLALVGLKPSLSIISSQASGQFRPDVCTSVSRAKAKF